MSHSLPSLTHLPISDDVHPEVGLSLDNSLHHGGHLNIKSFSLRTKWKVRSHPLFLFFSIFFLFQMWSPGSAHPPGGQSSCATEKIDFFYSQTNLIPIIIITILLVNHLVQLSANHRNRLLQVSNQLNMLQEYLLLHIIIIILGILMIDEDIFSGIDADEYIIFI